MAIRLEIMDNQRQAKNDKDAGNDVSDNSLENEQLIDAEKGDKAAERNLGAACIPIFPYRQTRADLFRFIVKIEYSRNDNQKYEYEHGEPPVMQIYFHCNGDDQKMRMDFPVHWRIEAMYSQIIDTIKQFDTIIIHRHVRPDPDAYGSQIGLKYILSHNYPKKRVLAAGEHDYTMDFLDFPDRVEDADFEGALVIVTDTANTDRIDDQRYHSGAKLVKIDHHPNDDNYGDICQVDTKASSSSEMIYELFTYGQAEENWAMPDASARLLYAGIIGDTGRFLFPSTTQKTFDVAGELIKYNFDRNELHNGMYEMDRKLLHLQGYMYQNFQMNENGAAFVKITQDILAKFDVTPTDTSLLVGSLGNVKGIKAWVILIEEDTEIRVRLRSKGPVINTLAKEFGGGGHPMASGAVAYSWDEADRVILRLEEICAKA